MRRPVQGDGEETNPYTLLADISLNSLGLILITLLVFMIQFCLTASQSLTSQQAPSPDETGLRVVRENQDLKRRVAHLENALNTRNREQGVTGLWDFQIRVTKLVDDQGRATPANFVVDYFVWLDISAQAVRGALFGVKEHGDRGLNSLSHAEIPGTPQGGGLNLELAFTGTGSGATEILAIKRMGDRFVGELKSGRGKEGCQNYAGPAQGFRLTKSVFSS